MLIWLCVQGSCTPGCSPHTNDQTSRIVGIFIQPFLGWLVLIHSQIFICRLKTNTFGRSSKSANTKMVLWNHRRVNPCNETSIVPTAFVAWSMMNMKDGSYLNQTRLLYPDSGFTNVQSMKHLYFPHIQCHISMYMYGDSSHLFTHSTCSWVRRL